MKKLINRPADVVDEMLDGIVLLNARVRRLADHHVIVRSDIIDPKSHKHVSVISGGGSGHEPAHAGYVGKGMLDAAVAGEVFTSPSPDAVLGAIRAVTGPAGAVLIVKNYTGDRLNFGLAAELARAEGYQVEVVIVADDVALRSATSESLTGARGLAGTLFVHKQAGAAALEGRNCRDVAAIARQTAENVGTMGVALTGCTVPAAGKPGFVLADDEIELGLGIHGEPGLKRIKLKRADDLINQLLDQTLSALNLIAGSRVALLVNNLGATPPMELNIVARHAIRELRNRGLIVERVYAGALMTALDMQGISLSVLKVTDEILSRLDVPTEAIAWPSYGQPSAALDHQATPTTDSLPIPAVPPTTDAGKRLRRAIEAACHSLIAAEPELTTLDQTVGDGDIGITLTRGSEAILQHIPYLNFEDPNTVLREIGKTLSSALGGSSGPLYASFFVRASTCLDLHDNTRSAWSEAFKLGCKAMMELGGAAEGERTMLDALIPAQKSLESSLAQPLNEILNNVTAASAQGAKATASMTPKRGRSSYIGDRAIGTADPGAVAVSIWLKAVTDSLPD